MEAFNYNIKKKKLKENCDLKRRAPKWNPRKKFTQKIFKIFYDENIFKNGSRKDLFKMFFEERHYKREIREKEVEKIGVKEGWSRKKEG